MTAKYKIPVLLFFLFFVMTSCTEDQRKGFEMKPSAVGKAGSILVVAENYVWEGVAGKAFKDHFGRTYEILPQPEPTFDLKFVEAAKLKELHKEWRNIIFLGVLGDKSAATKEIMNVVGKEGQIRAQEDPSFSSVVLEDRWADGQQIFMIFAPNQAELIAAIQKRQNTIEGRVIKSDNEQLWANNYQGGENTKLVNKLKKDLGLSIKIPVNYELAVYDSLEQTVWIRKETGSTSNNLLIKMMDYTEKNKLTKENIINFRDTLGRKFITTAAKDAYMLSDKVNLPIVFGERQVKDKFSLQARGLWKMHNDFMGGPFATYMILNPETQKVALIDGFIHAPGKEKRTLLQQVELIIGTTEF